MNSIQHLMKIKNIKIKWLLFEINNQENSYKDICLRKQNNNINKIKNYLSNSQYEIKTLEIFKTKIINEIIKDIKVCLNNDDTIKNIIIDISTSPKICFIPLLKWMLNGNKNILKNRNLIITYTKPAEYGKEEIESEPLEPYSIIGVPTEDIPIVWIPSLGFKPEFTKKIWENICLLSRDRIVIPAIGFPSYRPDYYDKCIFEHVNTFEDNNELIKIIKEKKHLLCSADDPFDIYQEIKNIISEHENRSIILSPIGSKPISLGMALIGIINNLPILTVQAKTYHPNYSKGSGSTMAYWIYRSNNYTFNV